MKAIAWILIVVGTPGFSNAQVTATEREVISLALQHHPTVQIAALEVQQARAMQRTAFNPDQPAVTIETPTDVGIGFEIEQEFAFPDVYFKRAAWLKSKTALATERGNWSRRELIRDVRIAFLEAQIAQSQVAYFTRQDSIWNALATSSQRLYDGGDITKADLVFAQHTAGTTMLANKNASAALHNALRQLESYTGEQVDQVESLRMWEIADTAGGYYFEPYYLQQEQVAVNETRMWRAQRAPDIILGYLRVPEPDTEYRYRFKAGLTIPIFQGQYSGEVQALKYEQASIAQELELKQREAAVALEQWEAIRAQTREAIDWYEVTGLPQQASLAEINMRLFDAGEIDYARALRNTSEAIGLQNDYFDLLERHNRAIIEIEFLKGIRNE